MDDRGCPSDPVFPGLEKDNQTGALLGKFEAFKFSDTTVVNFEVNVQFCQEKCNPVSIFLARCTAVTHLVPNPFDPRTSGPPLPVPMDKWSPKI